MVKAFNFWSSNSSNHSVRELVEKMSKHWPGTNWIDKSDSNQMPPEAGLLESFVAIKPYICSIGTQP